MSKRRKVLIYESVHREGTRLLEEKCEVVYPASLEEAHLLTLAGDIDGIFIRANGTVSRRLIEAAPRLKVIGRHGVGVENIDLTAAREKGVAVVYAPTANAQSVAEHFVGLALMLANKLLAADAALRAGYWKARLELTGRELFGKTLGVVGFGRIGQQTARICRKGFNMSVVYHDVMNFPEIEKELDARRVPIEQLFTEADFISFNLATQKTSSSLSLLDLHELAACG